MKPRSFACLATVLSLLFTDGRAQDAAIEIQADQVSHPLSRLMTGACIEDVNHEIYGGLYSQMIFGESFQEPPPAPEMNGFRTFGGHWLAKDGELGGSGSDGPKLVSRMAPFAEGEAGVEVWFPKAEAGNAGMIVKVNNAGAGADAFNGYEISLDTSGRLVLGRHRRNWEPIREAACEVPVRQWIPLTVRLTNNSLEIQVSGKTVIQFEDVEHPLRSGAIGLRTWQREARFRNFWVKTNEQVQQLPFQMVTEPLEISGQWSPTSRGDVRAAYSLVTNAPFIGAQSQRLDYTGGSGEAGIENRGLNRWGMNFAAGKPYQGWLWVRSERPTVFYVALEGGDGAAIGAEARLTASSRDWQRVEFTLTPQTNVERGRFSIKLKQAGALTVGYACLQPGDWGRFKGLPVRRDVAEGMMGQGITVLRYGGSMVNAAEYRWKKMIGPRDRRPPYHGTWYPYSSDGWGIIDFLEFCEAAGFVGIPAVNMNETPQDMADFIEYINGPPDSDWGRRRAADGHARPYGLKYLELGNEERVDAAYATKFEALADAIWAKDPDIVLVVGDFGYQRRIEDPFQFTGADSRITSLAGQQRILQLAKARHREVWFDVHVWTDGPRPTSSLQGAISFRDALTKIADGAQFHLAVFELNANNHAQRRALANGLAILALERDGLVPVVTSANGLQPDGENDNGWDQGLLFLNPSQVWLQPPGYVTQMLSRNYQPEMVGCELTNAANRLEAVATRSEDGKTLVMRVVNSSAQPVIAALKLDGFTPSNSIAHVEELAGALNAQNTAADPGRIETRVSDWKHGVQAGRTTYTFPADSFTVIRFN